MLGVSVPWLARCRENGRSDPCRAGFRGCLPARRNGDRNRNRTGNTENKELRNRAECRMQNGAVPLGGRAVQVRVQACGRVSGGRAKHEKRPQADLSRPRQTTQSSEFCEKGERLDREKRPERPRLGGGRWGHCGLEKLHRARQDRTGPTGSWLLARQGEQGEQASASSNGSCRQKLAPSLAAVWLESGPWRRSFSSHAHWPVVHGGSSLARLGQAPQAVAPTGLGLATASPHPGSPGSRGPVLVAFAGRSAAGRGAQYPPG